MTRPRDPARGLRAVMAATLTMEALVVLLALAPLSRTGDGLAGWRLAVLVALVVLLALAAGLLRRPYGITLGTGAQVALLAAGAVAWPVLVLGVLFGAVWAGLLLGRRRLGLDRPPGRGPAAG